MCLQTCTHTVSRLRQHEALLLYVVDTGQVSALFMTGSQRILPDHLFVSLQVITVACVRNPMTGAESGLHSGCTWKMKQGWHACHQKKKKKNQTSLAFSIYMEVLEDC